MPVNNMFSTGFNRGFGTGFGVGAGGWNNNGFQNPAQTKTTKQQKFPGLNQQQIANIEKYTANLTGAEKKQEQQKIYQAMIQAIEAEKFNDSRTAMENERYRNSLSKTDPRECKFDQSACRQSALVDLVKDARNLKANTDENTVMQMFMQEMDYRGIGMDKLNAYLDSGDETILYETGLKTQRGGTKDLINQAGTENKGGVLPKRSEWWNPIGAITETVDNAANKFADKFTVTGEKAASNLANKIQNMSKKEVAQYRKQYEKLLKDKDWRVGRVQGDTIVEQLWNGIKGNISYDYSDEDFMEWLVSQKADLGESLIGADDILKGETNPNVIQFFGNIPSSAVKTFTATVRGMTNPYDTMKGLYKLAATEEGHQALLQRYGSWDALANAMNSDPVGVADDMLAVAELGTNIAKAGLKTTGKIVGSQGLLDTAAKIEGWNIGSANDALAQKTVGTVYGGLDKLADISDSKAVKGTVRYAEDVSSIQQTVNDVKKVGGAIADSSVGQAVKNRKDEMINKIVGIDEKDRDFIQNNKKLVNDYLDGKKNVETVLDDIKKKIEQRSSENSKMGKEYDKLRAKGQTVSTEALGSDMVDKLRENKITINADGDLEFDKLSKYNPTQQKALQDAWQVIKDAQAAGTVDAGTILDLRQKFDDKVNWTGKPTELRNMSSVDKSTEKLIKEMRGVIDTRAKAGIDGLSKLDEKYAPAMEEMRNIKKDWFDSDGKIRDNARSKIRNLTKAGNEARLERLEKIAPGIKQDLKALDVGLTVQKATSQGVGQYAKGVGIAGSIGALTSGNIPALLASVGVGILATPKNFVKLIEAYPDIAEKLSAGQELLPSDMAKLQSLASRIQDGVEE